METNENSDHECAFEDSAGSDYAMTELSPALMVCGTTSNAGKTTLVVGLCRILARRGFSVAPFKAQNMALNSAVTQSGHEIGRAQFLQAQAAGVEPQVEMNPILLKPADDRTSQVVVEGLPLSTMSVREYHQAKPELFKRVMASLDVLRSRYDVVLLEGAGSPAEINLLDHDIVNLRVASEAGIPALVVGDINLGGVFAMLYGTVALLPNSLRVLVKAFVINKFRGDPVLLADGSEQLERLSGVPTLGVVPMLEDLRLDAEDSLALTVAPPAKPDAHLDVAMITYPHISNFTDIDPLLGETDMAVRFVRSTRELANPDLIVMPGSKATVSDLTWMRERGLAEAVTASDTVVLGICGGYQMLGTHINDDFESRSGSVAGLNLLDVTTTFETGKILAQRHGEAFGAPVKGYQIHHGRVHPTPNTDNQPWLFLDGHPEGYQNGRIMGTTLHGLFDLDEFRRAFLAHIAQCRGTTFEPQSASFTDHREAEIDRLADCLEAHLDIAKILDLIGISA